MASDFSNDDDVALSQYPLDEIVNSFGTSEEEKEPTHISFEEYRLSHPNELLSNYINSNMQ